MGLCQLLAPRNLRKLSRGCPLALLPPVPLTLCEKLALAAHLTPTSPAVCHLSLGESGRDRFTQAPEGHEP